MDNVKRLPDELKSFFAQEISASVVNVTTSVNDTMNRKFVRLINRLNQINARVGETTSRLEQLEEESKNTNSNLEEYSRKIEQLEQLVDDQINRNALSTVKIRGVKFNLCNEKK